MFGYVVADQANLKPEELERYRSAYCGLCRAIGRRHGQHARLVLTYDMTFLSLLLDSLIASLPNGVHRKIHDGIAMLKAERPLHERVQRALPSEGQRDRIKPHPNSGRRRHRFAIVVFPKMREATPEIFIGEHRSLLNIGQHADSALGAYAVALELHEDTIVIVIDVGFRRNVDRW